MNVIVKMSISELCFLFTPPPTCLDSVGRRPPSVGSNSEVQAGCCLWPGGVSVREAHVQPTVLQT